MKVTQRNLVVGLRRALFGGCVVLGTGGTAWGQSTTQGDQDATADEREKIHPARPAQHRHHRAPGALRQQHAIIGHGHAEGGDEGEIDEIHAPAHRLRHVVAHEIKPQVHALAHPHRRAEQDEPTHELQGQRLGPVGGIVQPVAREHLPADDERHRHQADPGKPERCRAHLVQHGAGRDQEAPQCLFLPTPCPQPSRRPSPPRRAGAADGGLT